MLSDTDKRVECSIKSIERSKELDTYETINKETNKILQSIL